MLEFIKIINSDYAGVLSLLSSLIMVVVTIIYVGHTKRQANYAMVAYGKDMNIVRRELKVPISHLCYILCTAAEDYYKKNKEKFDFIKYSIEDDRPNTFL